MENDKKMMQDYNERNINLLTKVNFVLLYCFSHTWVFGVNLNSLAKGFSLDFTKILEKKRDCFKRLDQELKVSSLSYDILHCTTLYETTH